VLIADPTRARQMLGFKPVHSDLSNIVETAWAWHRRAHPHRNATASERRSTQEQMIDARQQ
jgi:hypothetical protein